MVQNHLNDVNQSVGTMQIQNDPIHEMNRFDSLGVNAPVECHLNDNDFRLAYSALKKLRFKSTSQTTAIRKNRWPPRIGGRLADGSLG